MSGKVSNPDALLGGHRGVTTLTYVKGGTAPAVVLDYGKELGGYIQFKVASVIGSPTLRSSYSEVLTNLSSTGDGGPNSSLAGSGSANRYDDFSVEGAGALTSGNLQGGQRYEMVTLTQPGTVELSSASIRFSAFRGTPGTYRGYFLSSSPLLNRIWYAGAYTINLDQVLAGTQGFSAGTTIQTPNIVDGAKRDRAVWVGDLNVADRTAIDAFGGVLAPYIRGSLTLLGDYPEAAGVLLVPNKGSAQMPGPMPGTCPGESGSACPFYSATYSMFFVTDIYDYYLYTRDRQLVAREWPLVKRELEWENGQVDPVTGLFATTATDSADWDVNFSHPAGEYAAPSVLHYESLLDGAALADAVGDHTDAAAYRADAAAEKRAVNTNLWDAKLDAYDASTADRGFLVQDANVWAVLFGVASTAQSTTILHTLAAHLMVAYGMLNFGSGASPDYMAQVVSPYMSSYTVWADYAAGLPSLGLSLIEREWGWMVKHDPRSNDWERMESGGKLASSDSAAHGWGTGATPALSQFVLGIEPMSPGFASWVLRPQTGGLAWAQGRVPTPYGPIDSRWRIGSGKGWLKLTVHAPAGTAGVVYVPQLGDARTIAEDGRVVWRGARPAGGVQAGSSGDFVWFDARPGTHTFAWAAGRRRR